MRRPDIPVLTTLRFPAAFAIVLFHFLVYTPCPSWLWEGFNAGVAFFYVLSGFILYYNYVDLTDRGFFWTARFARIWPVHLFTLALIFILLPWWRLEGHASWEVTLPANVFLFHAWLPYQGGVLSYNGVSWSLSVEAFFYLCFPWLLGLMKSQGAALLLIVSFVLAFAIVLFSEIFLPGYAPFVWPFNPLTRLFEFVLGMTACRWWMREPAGTKPWVAWTSYEALGLAACISFVIAVPLSIHALGAENSFTSWLGSEIPVLAFAGLIWIFAHQAGLISRALSSRACEWFGEVSFALYMCHQIIIRWVDLKDVMSWWDATRFFVPYFAGSMLLSAAIFHFVETPARRAIVSAYKRSHGAATRAERSGSP
jgi:peptidoglycan/LPS O-acetylase OafA/YrhL